MLASAEQGGSSMKLIKAESGKQAIKQSFRLVSVGYHKRLIDKTVLKGLVTNRATGVDS
jgi:hypothetical protein